MEPEFWAERWRTGRIAFHQSHVNDDLARYFTETVPERGSTVLVPLCGKSRDMLWLAAEGYRVLGVEVVELAVRAFFEENQLEPVIEQHGALKSFRHGAIEILCGDVFDLAAGDVADVHGIYDRAALVALPPSMRRRYAEHLRAILPPAWRMLLLTLEYDESARTGPPFSVRGAEVSELFGAGADIELLETRQSTPDDNGVDARESVWRIVGR